MAQSLMELSNVNPKQTIIIQSYIKIFKLGSNCIPKVLCIYYTHIYNYINYTFF